MRRFFKVLAAAIPLLVGSFAAAASFDQLAATKHNFALGTYSAVNNDANNTMCQPCHTPHHAIVDEAISDRLWNHELSTTDYTLYGGATGAYTSNIDGSQGMDRVSRLCLGCHDGTVALDSFGMGATTNTRHQGTRFFNAGDVSNLGTDFSNDHPVGITAIATDAAGALPSGSHLKAPTVTYNTTGVPSSGVKSVKIGNISLAKMDTGNYVVGCKSCHNPHGAGLAAQTPYAHMLADTPSTLCNNCHTK